MQWSSRVQTTPVGAGSRSLQTGQDHRSCVHQSLMDSSCSSGGRHSCQFSPSIQTAQTGRWYILPTSNASRTWREERASGETISRIIWAARTTSPKRLTGLLQPLPANVTTAPERYATLLEDRLEPGHNRFLTISIGAGKKHERRGGGSKQFAGIVTPTLIPQPSSPGQHIIAHGNRA